MIFQFPAPSILMTAGKRQGILLFVIFCWNWHHSMEMIQTAKDDYNRIFFNFRQDKIAEHCGRNTYGDWWSRQRFAADSVEPPSSVVSPRIVNKRIIGGMETRLGEWPWLVSLMFQRQNNNVIMHFCAGTLIHPQWVLTAEHCFVPNSEYPDLTQDNTRWIARIGEHDMTNEAVPHLDMAVERIFLHVPGSVPHSNDIALMKLAAPVRLSRNVNVACLPLSDEVLLENSLCKVIGWGYVSEGGTEIAQILRHVEVPIVSHELCNLTYGSLRSPNGEGQEIQMGISSTQICAGDLEGGKDSCQFDSGGPLMCPSSSPDGSTREQQWLVSGIVSYGYGCGRAQFPGVYTRVAGFIPWIKQITNLF